MWAWCQGKYIFECRFCGRKLPLEYRWRLNGKKHQKFMFGKYYIYGLYSCNRLVLQSQVYVTQMTPKLGVLNTVRTILLCTAQSGSFGIVSASALLPCAHLWKVCYDPLGLSRLLLHQLPAPFQHFFLPLTLPFCFLEENRSIERSVTLGGAPYGIRIPKKSVCVTLMKTCSCSIVGNLALLENSLPM